MSVKGPVGLEVNDECIQLIILLSAVCASAVVAGLEVLVSEFRLVSNRYVGVKRASVAKVSKSVKTRPFRLLKSAACGSHCGESTFYILIKVPYISFCCLSGGCSRRLKSEART